MSSAANHAKRSHRSTRVHTHAAGLTNQARLWRTERVKQQRASFGGFLRKFARNRETRKEDAAGE